MRLKHGASAEIQCFAVDMLYPHCQITVDQKRDLSDSRSEPLNLAPHHNRDYSSRKQLRRLYRIAKVEEQPLWSLEA